MTPSASGLIREPNAGARDTAAVAGVAAPRTDVAALNRQQDQPRAFHDVLRERRQQATAPTPAVEPSHEKRPRAGASAAEPTPPLAQAQEPDDSAQEPIDAAQETDQSSAVSAEPDRKPAQTPSEDPSDSGSDRHPSVEATDDVEPPATPSGQAQSAQAQAPHVADSGIVGAAPTPTSQQVEAAGPSDSAPATPPPTAGEPSAITSANPSNTAQTDTKASPEQPAATAPGARVDSSRSEKKQAPRAAEPSGTTPAKGEKPNASEPLAGRAPTAPEPDSVDERKPQTAELPLKQHSAESRSAEARPVVVPHKAEHRSANGASGRTVFVLSSDDQPAQAVRTTSESPAAAKSESGPTPAPQATATPSETSTQPVAQAQSAASADSDSKDPGARRETPQHRAEAPQSADSGAQRDSGAGLSPDLGSRPAPTLGDGAASQIGKPVAQSAPAEAQIVAQSVARGLTAAVNQRGGSVTLRLVPESLGLVRIHMSIDQGAVSVRLEATNQAAQGLLTEHIAMLRGSLESRGLTIEKLSVQYAPATSVAGAGLSHGAGQNSAGANQQQMQQADDQQAAWQDAAGGQSRGRRDGQQEGRQDHPHGVVAQTEADASRAGSPFRDRIGGRLRLRLETVA